MIDAIEKVPVLRFVAGYPLPPDPKSTSKSVVQALNPLGPNPLATLTVDTFRAYFISEDEARNVLGPLEAALARKRERKRKPLPRKHKPAPKQNAPTARKRKASEMS